MAKFGTQSLTHLNTCDERLQKLFLAVVEEMDCKVLCGHRNEADQEKAFQSGASQVHFPNSKHNTYPSVAVDVVPYPIDWNDRKRFEDLYYVVMKHAQLQGLNVRWGANWDQDNEFWERSNWECDGPHYELC